MAHSSDAILDLAESEISSISWRKPVFTWRQVPASLRLSFSQASLAIML